MIREHPRFQKTAIIFISAIHLTDMDRLRGYEMGAVDYVPVPVMPEVLRAKVRVFAELYRKTRQLEQLNAELEQRVAERTAELEASTARLRAERAAPQPRAGCRPHGLVGLGSASTATASGTTGQYRIFGVDPGRFEVTVDNIAGADPSRGLERICRTRIEPAAQGAPSVPDRIPRLPSERRDALVHRHRRARASMRPAMSCASAASPSTSPIARKPRSARRCWPARSIIAPRTRLALVQSIVRLTTRATTIKAYIAAVEGRIGALSRAHTLLVAVALAGRRPARPGRRGAGALSHGRRRPDHRRRTRRSLEPAHRADAGAGAARACHQRRQIRRAVRHVGAR